MVANWVNNLDYKKDLKAPCTSPHSGILHDRKQCEIKASVLLHCVAPISAHLLRTGHALQITAVLSACGLTYCKMLLIHKLSRFKLLPRKVLHAQYTVTIEKFKFSLFRFT